MRSDVRTFVAAGETCQLTKYDNRKPAGLLCPLPVPYRPWEDLSMDFIVGLPTYKGHTSIFVVVDRFSKGLHLGMLPTKHSARKVAELFTSMVTRLHGLPRSIISDMDPLFVSRFWRELFELSGPSLGSVRRTIHKQMVRQRLRIGLWSSTYGPWFTASHRRGGDSCYRLSGHITPHAILVRG